MAGLKDFLEETGLEVTRCEAPPGTCEALLTVICPEHQRIQVSLQLRFQGRRCFCEATFIDEDEARSKNFNPRKIAVRNIELSTLGTFAHKLKELVDELLIAANRE